MTEQNTPQSGVRPIVLTPKELAELMQVTEEHLERMRAKRQGPPWVYLGRPVRYRRVDVHEWLEHNRAAPTPRSSKKHA